MKRFLKDERGAMNIGGIMMMGIAMVFLAVGFIMFPIATTACTTLLDWTYTPYPSITDATYTGYTAIVGITPLMILIGFVSAAVITGFLGMKVMKGSEGSTKLSPGNMLMLGLSIVFIAIALIIEPVMLDGISSVAANKAEISDSAVVSTAPAVTIGSITLSETLYNDSLSEFISVSSNITETSLAADNYTSGKIYLTGLTDNASRTITAAYYYADLLSSFSGLYGILLVCPMLIHVSFLAAAVVSGFFGIRNITKA